MGRGQSHRGGGWGERKLRQPGVGPALWRAWPWLIAVFAASAIGAGLWVFLQPDWGERLLRLSGPGLWPASAAIGGVVGLALGTAFVIGTAPKRVTSGVAERFADSFDGTILAMTPALGARDLRQVAPDLRDPPGVVVSLPQSLFAECARAAATRISRWRAGEAGMAVSFIAASPREGASAIALSVARSLALAGRRVALIDTDVRDRTISISLDLTEGRGLWTALDAVSTGSEVFAEDHLAPDTYTSLLVLPQSAGWSPMREVYGHPHFKALLDALKQRFDFVVLDCGPVGLVDGRMSAVAADAAIIVTRWNATLARHLAVTQQGLRQLGGVLPGVILNGAPPAAVQRWLAKS